MGGRTRWGFGYDRSPLCPTAFTNPFTAPAHSTLPSTNPFQSNGLVPGKHPQVPELSGALPPHKVVSLSWPLGILCSQSQT